MFVLQKFKTLICSDYMPIMILLCGGLNGLIAYRHTHRGWIAVAAGINFGMAVQQTLHVIARNRAERWRRKVEADLLRSNDLFQELKARP